jgi:hypothetical protein
MGFLNKTNIKKRKEIKKKRSFQKNYWATYLPLQILTNEKNALFYTWD